MNLNTLPQKEARWANCPKPLRNHATYCFSEQWNCYAKCEVHCRFRKVSQPTVFSAMSSSSFWAPMGQLEYLVNLKCVTIVLSEFQFLHTLWNSIIILKTHLLISLKALQRDEGRERGRRERGPAICWFTPEITVMVRAVPWLSQDLGTSSGSLTWVAGAWYMGCLLLPFPGPSRDQN